MNNRLYEIHLLRGGKWETDSVFDDRTLALWEANRIEDAGRYVGIRVIEEKFDELSLEFRSRTIYHGSKAKQANLAALQKARAVRERVARKKAWIALKKAQQAAAAERAEWERKTNPFRLVGLFGFIALLGICAVIALRLLYEMV